MVNFWGSPMLRMGVAPLHSPITSTTLYLYPIIPFTSFRSYYMYTVHVHCTCTLYMYTVHVHCTCTHVQRTCTLYMYTVHVHCTCTLYMYTVHVHVLYMYTCTCTVHVHVHCTCTLYMYTVHVRCTYDSQHTRVHCTLGLR